MYLNLKFYVVKKIKPALFTLFLKGCMIIIQFVILSCALLVLLLSLHV